jgi:hypothetical protein
VNTDKICPGIDKCIDISLGTVDHQMNVEKQFGRTPQCLDDRRAKGDIGDEKPVHDIPMDPFETGLLQTRELALKIAEIRGQQ